MVCYLQAGHESPLRTVAGAADSRLIWVQSSTNEDLINYIVVPLPVNLMTLSIF